MVEPASTSTNTTQLRKGPRRVVILVFDDVEILDFAGPYEVFSVAGELSEPTAFSVQTAAVKQRGVVARGGLAITADVTIDDCAMPDVLVIPGGTGSRAVLKDEALLQWVTRATAQAEHVLSVCTGALIRAATGALESHVVTTHHDAFEELKALTTTSTIVDSARFVRATDRIWTSGGISAGIDLSLAVVEHVAGRSVQQAVVDEMEWGWPRD